jgi:hypothetical protein
MASIPEIIKVPFLPPSAAIRCGENQSVKSECRKEFRINDTQVVYIQQGTSFLSIAQQYNVPLARLFNSMNFPVRGFGKDQLIYFNENVNRK